jgi:surfeit locus 1 family protein
LPVVLPEPELDEGPHLSYAVQWFVFATIAAVGYPLVLRRLSRRGPGRSRPSKVPLEYLEGDGAS